MYVSDIKETFLDFPDDESLAVIIFFRGCFHNCPNCQNKELQTIPKDEKNLSAEEVAEMIINRCKRSSTNKIVLSGGDPFAFPNNIIKLIDYLEARGYVICTYTGYDIDAINNFYNNYESSHKENIHKSSYFKCGLYREDLRDYGSGKFNDKFVLASTNQAFYKLINNRYEQISKGHTLYFNE